MRSNNRGNNNNKTKKREQIFFSDFREIDTSKIVYEGPIGKKYAQSEYYYTYAYYNDNGDFKTLHFLAPEQFCYGLSYNHGKPQSGVPQKATKDGEEINKQQQKKDANGIQLTYLLHSKETLEGPTSEELKEKYKEECEYEEFLEKIDKTIKDEVEDVKNSSKKTKLPKKTQQALRGANLDSDDPEDAYIKKSYDEASANSKNKSRRQYIPVTTSGKGDQLHCPVKFIVDGEDEPVSAIEFIGKRGQITPVIYFEGISWNGSKNVTVLPKYKVTEAMFRETESETKTTSFLSGFSSKKPTKKSQESGENDDDSDLFPKQPTSDISEGESGDSDKTAKTKIILKKKPQVQSSDQISELRAKRKAAGKKKTHTKKKETPKEEEPEEQGEEEGEKQGEEEEVDY